MSHDESCKKLRSLADKYFPSKIITPFIKMLVKNELQKDYTEERDFTIGHLTEKEKL